jgi:hypothetical protein
MSPIDVAGDSGGFLAAIVAAVAHLESTVASMSLLLEVLITAVCILVAVEVARGVMKR